MTASKTGKHLAGFILFPMMFFLLLSCPTKRELKQMMNIHLRTVKVKNCNKVRNTCSFEVSAPGKEQNNPQYTHLAGLSPDGTQFCLPSTTVLSEQVRRNTDVFIQQSLFICYRKLII